MALQVVSLDGNNSLDDNFFFFLLCFSLQGIGPGRQLQNQKGLEASEGVTSELLVARASRELA